MHGSNSYAEVSSALHGCVNKFDTCANVDVSSDGFNGAQQTSGIFSKQASGGYGRRNLDAKEPSNDACLNDFGSCVNSDFAGRASVMGIGTTRGVAARALAQAR